MKISIDPGFHCTGVVYWPENGNPPWGHPYWPPKSGRNVESKRRDLIRKILRDIKPEHEKDPITAICIEKFVYGYRRKFNHAVGPLERFTGMLLGALFVWCLVYAPDVEIVEICKGQVGKGEGSLVACAYSFQHTNQDVIDAFHLGVLAGYR